MGYSSAHSGVFSCPYPGATMGMVMVMSAEIHENMFMMKTCARRAFVACWGWAMTSNHASPVKVSLREVSSQRRRVKTPRRRREITSAAFQTTAWT